MNEEQQVTWLRRLRESLRQGNMDQLTLDAEEMGLDALLDPSFLTLARQHSAHQVVILIATLGQANRPESANYDRLLAAFQLLTKQISLDKAAQICAQSSQSTAAFYTELLKASSDPSYVATFDRVPAATVDLEFAVALLVDCERSDMALELMKCWQKADLTEIPWLKTCKAIATRTKEVTLRPEAHRLAKSIEKLIGLAPGSQAKVRKEMKIQWATMALKSQDPVLSLKAAQAAFEEDVSMSQRLNLVKALILSKAFDEATQQLEKMLELALKESDNTNHVNNKPKGIFNIQAAEQTLLTVNHLLKNKGLKPFIMSGTLLGYQRNQALMPHDKDIDIGIIGWENQFTIAQALLEAGFFKFDLSQLTGHNRYLISAYDMRNGMAIDFFLFHDHDDHFLHGIDFDIAITQNFRFSRFDLKEVDFLGDRFFTPSNIEENLSENYGDWKTPVTSYVVTVESPALCPFVEGKNLLAYLEILKTINKRLNPDRVKRIINHLKNQKDSGVPENLMTKLEDWCNNQYSINNTPSELSA
jgi:hypothetical protein